MSERPDPSAGMHPSEEELLERQLRRTSTARPATEKTPIPRPERSRRRGRTNRLAVTAFVIATVIPIAGVIPAFVLGYIALDEIRESDGAERGSGLAWAAILISLVILLFAVLIIALLIAGD